MPDYAQLPTNHYSLPQAQPFDKDYTRFDDTAQKVIKHKAKSSDQPGVKISQILDGRVHSEGHDVARVECEKGKNVVFTPDSSEGHVISFTEGQGRLEIDGKAYRVGSRQNGLANQEGEIHCYIPKGKKVKITSDGANPLKFEQMSSNKEAGSDAPGKKFIIRDEKFLKELSGSYTDDKKQEQTVSRWVVTPQYTSRRVFLDHDSTLTAKDTKDPVSMWHTSMNDTTTLPNEAINEDGIKVFRMSYNNGTEFNIIQNVTGQPATEDTPKAEVRFALHPYADENKMKKGGDTPASMDDVQTQKWSDWMPLTGQETYYLNEPAGSEETVTEGGVEKNLRNRHEVRIDPGCIVFLHCSFNPAPTGNEKHAVGLYSGYQKPEVSKAHPAYPAYIEALKNLDTKIDEASEEALRIPSVAQDSNDQTAVA